MTKRKDSRSIVWRVGVFEALASTSDLLILLADRGEPAGLMILAHYQTVGRGSRGRDWVSPEGNLAFSVLLRPKGPAADAGHWALLSAVVLAETLAHHAPDAELSLKWPNDVLLAGRKVGGVLIDSATTPEGNLHWLVIGFGANLGAAPELKDGVAAGLGTTAEPGDVAATLKVRLEDWYHVVQDEGFASVHQAWLARAHPIGTELRVRAGNTRATGQFAGLSDDGALLLQSGGRVRAFPTGEILQAEG